MVHNNTDLNKICGIWRSSQVSKPEKEGVLTITSSILRAESWSAAAAALVCNEAIYQHVIESAWTATNAQDHVSHLSSMAWTLNSSQQVTQANIK